MTEDEQTMTLYRPVGGSVHQELWVPAEELDEFNRNIVGLIEVIAEFAAPDAG